MAIAGLRKISLAFTGDQTLSLLLPAASNANSPLVQELKNLAAGFNLITVPVAAPAVPTAVTIIPPAGNAQSMILKGVTGDTGVRLHNTDLTSISLDASVATFGITAGGIVTGVRLIWN
jgi:hypothetical protein